MIQVTRFIAVDEREIRLRFVRASGPGGQNVNKAATAVQLRFDAAHSPSIPDDVRERLLRIAGGKATAEGVVIIQAGRFRTQERNRQDAIDRLVSLIRKAAERPRPRRRTTPSQASKERRLEAKRRRGEAKRMRKAAE